MPVALWSDVSRALSIPNPDKPRMISERIPGAKDLPDSLELWNETETLLQLPRGFVHTLERLAGEHHVPLDWDRQMTLRQGPYHGLLDWKPVELRDYQIEARDQMLDWGSGILQAPTGSGKTRIALEVARWGGEPTLIIVDRTALAQQWKTVIEESYGYEAGVIGDGSWNEREVTIALRQSLWSRREEISAQFWTRWGMLLVDEVHHASAETLMDLVQRFPAFYRFGLSATPVWDKLLFPYIEAAIGPIVHRTFAKDIGEVLVKPSIVVVPTTFEFEFERTRMRGHYRVQNNYTEMMAELCGNDHRNDQIAGIAIEESSRGHHVLVTSRRLEHIEQMRSRLVNREVSLFVLTGKSSREYESVREAIANAEGGTVTLSTIADEALDIPRLDRLIMAFPARRVKLVEQQIGRIMRPAPGKTDAIVYDFYDEKIGVCKGQFRDRQQQLYLRSRWTVRNLLPSQP